MYDDAINNLLRGVADGSIAVKDARNALEGVELTEEQMDQAVNHGVHDVAESGTIVSASLAPSGGSCLLYTSPSPRDATLSRMPSSA